MSSLRESLPGQRARRWLAHFCSPSAMESVFDPFLADLQADWLHAKSTRGALYTRWSLLCAYVSLVVQVAAFAIGALFGASYELAPAAHSGAGRVAAGAPAPRTFRYAAPLLAAGLMTFGLFTLMSALIASSPEAIIHKPPIPVNLIRPPEPPKPIACQESKLPTLPDPAPVVTTEGIPVTTPLQHRPTLLPGRVGPWFDGAEPDFLDSSGGVPVADRGETPIVRVEPVYPQHALERGVEGWVDVEFTVTESGGIADPKILGSYPSAIFNRAALRAIGRWKYAPKIVDGHPVARPGMRTRFRFELGGGRS